MLTYALAWIIALASFGLFLTASAFPEIHRKNDVILGALGSFYALVLLANAKTMPLGLLLGQVASVTLIVWLGRQSLQQRSVLASPDTPRPEPGSLDDRLRNLMINIGQLWEPLVAILVDGLRSSLNRGSDSEAGKASESGEEAPQTNLWAKLGDSIAKVVSGEGKSDVQKTVTVAVSHDVADEGEMLVADAPQNADATGNATTDAHTNDLHSDNPEISNPEISNPEISNPEIGNTEIGNTEIGNTEIGNTVKSIDTNPVAEETMADLSQGPSSDL